MCSLSGEVHSIQWKFCVCTKLGTDSTKQRCPLNVQKLCAGMRFVRNLCVPCPVLVQFTSLMPGGPDSLLDFYTTCNRSTRCVQDSACIFSGRQVTRTAWKLANNSCEMATQGRKLMTYIWGIIKHSFPISFCHYLLTCYLSWVRTFWNFEDLHQQIMDCCDKDCLQYQVALIQAGTDLLDANHTTEGEVDSGDGGLGLGWCLIGSDSLVFTTNWHNQMEKREILQPPSVPWPYPSQHSKTSLLVASWN